MIDITVRKVATLYAVTVAIHPSTCVDLGLLDDGEVQVLAEALRAAAEELAPC